MRLSIYILLGILCIGCKPQQPTVNKTSANDRSPSTSVSEPEDVVIIDVRSNEEWESGHLAQAIHIPHAEIAQQIERVASDKDAKIVLYCAAGGRAGRAKEVLDGLGYTQVENAGGYDDVKLRYESD
ncbi:MAG: rhodanese-like domain-containing protein [Aureliella sp.]